MPLIPSNNPAKHKAARSLQKAAESVPHGSAPLPPAGEDAVLSETRQWLADDARLEELEAVVDRGLDTFVEVGTALEEIRDTRLYRLHHHNTFADYVAKRFGHGRDWGYKQIAAAQVVREHVARGLQPPATEREARRMREAERIVASDPVEQLARISEGLERAPRVKPPTVDGRATRKPSSPKLAQLDRDMEAVALRLVKLAQQVSAAQLSGSDRTALTPTLVKLGKAALKVSDAFK